MPDQSGNSSRDMDQRMPIGSSRLNKGDMETTAFREAVGENASRGASTDDDVIIMVRELSLSAFSNRAHSFTLPII
jgi:hypothetical protein